MGKALIALAKKPVAAKIVERFSSPIAVALWAVAVLAVVFVAYIALVLLGYADIQPLLLVIEAFH
ncbi:hypothetical protein [Selenomonas sp. AB3002]|uniref:hypothetical protein n=1 Tax=Selenomonas sp. AB3002 TaxID=1392502 RepID=UPI0004965E8C